jgi:hypothetical protein
MNVLRMPKAISPGGVRPALAHAMMEETMKFDRKVMLTATVSSHAGFHRKRHIGGVRRSIRASFPGM